MAKFPRPNQDLSGCNAVRLWFKPYGLKDSEGTVCMGFIDGSSEIWQENLPEVLSGTEPCVIQVRLADFPRVLRRNNGRIDLENRDFCFWMTGTYKFTVDDILFVHDPAVPEFSGPSESAVRPWATNWVTSTQQDTMSMIYNVPDTDGLRKEERSTQSIIPGRIRE